MTRNTELHFANLPNVKIGRSKFDKSFTHKTTFSAGKLYPIYVDATIMPGDTVKMSMSEVVRMMTPICPVMDNAYEDIYFFFVPHRLVWTHFKEFMGENTTDPWVQTTPYQIPQISAPTEGRALTGHKGWTKGSIADYMGIPTEVDGFTINALPFRAYSLIWNEFFRDENIMYPVRVEQTVDSTQNGYTTGSDSDQNYPLYSPVRGGSPLPVCKLHDYFTSCLPNSQKGNSVMVPVGGQAPIKLGDAYNGTEDDEPLWYPDDGTGQNALIRNHHITMPDESLVTTGQMSYETDSNEPKSDNLYYSTNQYYRMYADLTAATGATVNQLRQAFAIQKFMERDARNGTRFIELIQSHFNVTNPDYRLQRPEYLGGKRIPINMNTVVQNSPEVSDSTPLGTTGAYSVTSDNDEFFTKSFTEWGTLIGLICIRTDRTYQQGLNRQWSQKDKYDFYFPEFANLGEEAILNKEIYLQGDSVKSEGKIVDNEAFGYQERWANYRYTPDIVTGEMRSNYGQSLDIWHYADYYEELPTLSPDWLEEDDANIERTLAVQDHDQFLGDFFFKATYTRPMPLYSVPGLIDHH